MMRAPAIRGEALEEWRGDSERDGGKQHHADARRPRAKTPHHFDEQDRQRQRRRGDGHGRHRQLKDSFALKKQRIAAGLGDDERRCGEP